MMEMTTVKPLEHYLNLKYPMEVVREDEGTWFVSVPDLPGCNSVGTTLPEAIDNVQEAKALWIKSQLEAGGEIPEPTDDDDFSGKFILRIPKVLHRSLACQARKQGASLNQYATYLLSERHSWSMIHSILDRCMLSWQQAQNTWIHHHESAKNKIISMGARLPGNVDLVVHLSKPAPKRTIRVPQTIEEQYQLTNASDR